MTQDQLATAWKIQKNPPSITRNYQFETYQDTSKFLEELAELSQKMNFYPNLNFTRTQVNVSIDLSGKNETCNQDIVEYGFASEVDTLIPLSKK